MIERSQRCDWIDDFEKRFNGHKELQNIKRDKKHGKLEINFYGGVPMNVNFSIHFKPDISPTLTKGGEDGEGKKAEVQTRPTGSG